VKRAGKRELLIDEARSLYAKGKDLDAIARSLDVSKHTLRNWKAYDRQRGRCWDEERKRPFARSPDSVLRALEQRFERMVLEEAPRSGQEDREHRQYEQRLLNMVRIITGYRKTARELTIELRALEQFAAFCAENLAPTEFAAVRRAIRQFIQRLKEQH